jgi:hypothetical protein
MTEQLDKLSALLLRVQENRRAPRAARGAGPVAAAMPRAAPAAVARPAQQSPADDFADMTPAPLPPPRRPSVDRRATPLEMAVAGELEQQLAAASEARAIAAPPAEVRREAPAARPVRPPAAPAVEAQALQALQPAQSPQSMEPRIIEPDPPREIVRPIAQVMSKHAPPVDATFGAMLKRSLSLRPH